MPKEVEALYFDHKYGILDITIYAMHYILFCPWELLVHSSLSLPTTYSCHNSSGHSAIKPSLLSSFTTSPNLHPFHYYYQIQFNLLKFFVVQARVTSYPCASGLNGLELFYTMSLMASVSLGRMLGSDNMGRQAIGPCLR